ncbi:MAG: hypothetical protein ACRCZV_09260 [Sediminibacterium sp.]
MSRQSSKERLSGVEYNSPNMFRELKARKCRFGFTTRVFTPEEIIGTGLALDEVKKFDPMMNESVVQFNRHHYEKNRIFIYTNNEFLADKLRDMNKVAKNVYWKHSLKDIA